jgi:DNA-binding NtrC family response regulator
MSHKILICDDEEGIRESLKLILGDFYDLILTDNGNQCLDCLKNSKDIKLVLMDIKMPKVNGLEVLRKIKQERPDVDVIIITGYKSVETATEAVRLGASGYIVKPFKSNEILTTVKKVFTN